MKSLYYRITTLVLEFGRKYHWWLAGALLALMFGLSYSSMIGESAIVDEVAHIPAAYSYLHYGDYRLNPEHPPLIKDLAGLPLQFMHLKFPEQEPAWTTDVNGQWEAGWNFLYHIGNNANRILWWARLPVLLLAVGFGAWLYWFCRRHWGAAVALLALFFYCLSPNILAHAHYVTTDLGATVFIFLALATFVRFARHPLGNNLILLSFALAGAQLAKFSGILLYAFLGVWAVIMVWKWPAPRVWTMRLRNYLGGYVAAAALSLLWIWLYYIPHTLHMPQAVQQRLVDGSLTYGPITQVLPLLHALEGVPLLRPLVQYLLGVSMVYGRVSGGNVTYFDGVVTNHSFHAYFPELFVLKTQLPLLILLVTVVGTALWVAGQRRHGLSLDRAVAHARRHLLEWTIGAFAVFYFLVSVAGNLNLGIRHILPVYAPLFVLVAAGTVKLTRRLDRTRWRGWWIGVLAGLLVWYAGSTFWIHPTYTAYFNELIGGPDQAGKYFSDSSVDWGQDLRRLREYTDKHPEIKHLALDYFGGGEPRYYFCDRRYTADHTLVADASGYDCTHSIYDEWHSDYGPYKGQYIAVSETFLENDRYYAAQLGQAGYEYLRQMKPVAKIGYSIYLYKLY